MHWYGHEEFANDDGELDTRSSRGRIAFKSCSSALVTSTVGHD